MVLEKIRKRTPFQHLKVIVLGKNKPGFLTRISVIVGSLIWLYLFSWQILTFLSILLLGNLENSPQIRASYNHVGFSNYGYTDTINRVLIHSAIQIVIYLLIGLGLVLIWRRKKLGYLLHLGGNAVSLLISFLMMGWYYMANEITIVDYILIGISTFYFALYVFLFKDKENG